MKTPKLNQNACRQLIELHKLMHLKAKQEKIINLTNNRDEQTNIPKNNLP